MCGIAGFFSRTKTIAGKQYYDAHKKMSHRGPDDEGFLVFEEGEFIKCDGTQSQNAFALNTDIRTIDNIGKIMSHVRLSILDLSYFGHQPYVSEDEGIAISFNGEIYNFLELRELLVAKGYIFKSQSDTEVVMRAYEEWGTNAFKKFNGMWAIGIYDKRKNELILSRDRLGVKPLFYYYYDSTIIFASEMKVILEMVPRATLNTVSVKKYLSNCCLFDSEDTFFNEIKEVEPAHYLVFRNECEIARENYWNFTPEIRWSDYQDAEQQFGVLFGDSVCLRMRSDVAVGSLLSGGLDSSVIVGELGKRGFLSSEYQTFSSVYTQEKYSERKYIEQTQKLWGIKSNYIYMEPYEIIEELDHALLYSEVPIRSITFVLQNKLYSYIKEHTHTKVVLNGQGADELFGGYTNDYFSRFYELLCTHRWITFMNEMRQFHKNRNFSYYRMIRGAVGQRVRIGNKGENSFNFVTFQSMITTPFREYLMLDDRSSMAYGIEARAPFIDYRLVEFAFSLPSGYKINAYNNKRIVRDYAKNIVDTNILNRKDKMGFTSPHTEWQKNEWKQFFDEEFEEIRKNGLPGLEEIDAYTLYKDYLKGKYHDEYYIWRIFCFSRWNKIFVTNE